MVSEEWEGGLWLAWVLLLNEATHRKINAICGRKAWPFTMKSLVTKTWGLLLSFFLHPLLSMCMGSIQLASSLLFPQSSASICPKPHFWRVTPSLNKGPAVPAWVSLAPGVQIRESCALEAAGAAGHSQPSMSTGGSFIHGAVSPSQ